MDLSGEAIPTTRMRMNELCSGRRTPDTRGAMSTRHVRCTGNRRVRVCARHAAHAAGLSGGPLTWDGTHV